MEKAYSCLEERILQFYLETTPPCCLSQAVSETGQREFYDFITGIYRILAAEPHRLSDPLHEDGCYRNRYNRASEQKPELYRNMQAIRKKMDGLLTLLWTAGREGRLAGNTLFLDKRFKITKKQIALLERFGLKIVSGETEIAFFHETYGELFAVWQWMARREDMDLFRFSRCLFAQDNEAHSYAVSLFTLLCGNEAELRRLRDYFRENGFRQIDFRGNTVALDFVKSYAGIKKEFEEPVKEAWGERTHSGLSLKYDFYAEHPFCCSLRIPRCKELLAHFDSMNGTVQQFVLRYHKKCDGCRYCVQTDKTGERPFSGVPVRYDREYRLCPYFPGFNYTWNKIDANLTDEILQFLDFTETLFGRAEAGAEIP